MQEEKGCGRPLLVRRQLSHFYIGQFTFSQLAGCCCCFPHLTCPMTLPNIFSKIDSSPEAYGILASLIMGWCLLFLDPQGAFLHMCSVSFAPRMGNMWPLDLSLKQDLAPLCSCHDYCLKVSTGSKAWLFILFQVSLPFRRANRRLVVSILTWSPLTPCFRKFKQVISVWPEVHLFLAPRNVNRRSVVNI